MKVARVTRTTSSGEAAARPVRTVSIAADDPVSVGQRPPSPARRPASNVVHVTGLVRPFTVGQLKELLGRTGTLADDGFWIDSIKSHCYAVVRTRCACVQLISRFILSLWDDHTSVKPRNLQTAICKLTKSGKCHWGNLVRRNSCLLLTLTSEFHQSLVDCCGPCIALSKDFCAY